MSGPACDARPASAYVNNVDIPQNPKLAIVATQPGQNIMWNAIQNWFGDQPGARQGGRDVMRLGRLLQPLAVRRRL